MRRIAALRGSAQALPRMSGFRCVSWWNNLFAEPRVEGQCGVEFRRTHRVRKGCERSCTGGVGIEPADLIFCTFPRRIQLLSGIAARAHSRPADRIWMGWITPTGSWADAYCSRIATALGSDHIDRAGRHSWRTGMWRSMPGWSAEDERVSDGGKWDPRPALLIHAAGQQSANAVTAPTSLMVVHDFVAAQILKMAQ